MESARPTGVMPLRPLTLGELLDAAVTLLRAHARTFLVAAFVLAAIEQAVLYPLRAISSTSPPLYLPYDDRLGLYWLTLGFGLGTEAFILAVLGGLTSAAAGPALLAAPITDREVRSRCWRRAPAIVAVAVVAGVAATVAALAGLLPWIVVYGLIGPAVPVLVVDRRGPAGAIGRGLLLAGRSGLRATWVRLVGYLGWLAIRLAMGLGGVKLLSIFVPATDEWLRWIGVVVWLVVNAVAYATLACLDSVLYLETRMRTEALDLAVGRELRLGRPVDLAATP